MRKRVLVTWVMEVYMGNQSTASGGRLDDTRSSHGHVRNGQTIQASSGGYSRSDRVFKLQWSFQTGVSWPMCRLKVVNREAGRVKYGGLVRSEGRAAGERYSLPQHEHRELWSRWKSDDVHDYLPCWIQWVAIDTNGSS